MFYKAIDNRAGFFSLSKIKMKLSNYISLWNLSYNFLQMLKSTETLWDRLNQPLPVWQYHPFGHQLKYRLLYFLIQLPIKQAWEQSGPHRRPGSNSRLLALAWPSCGHWNHLESKPADGMSRHVLHTTLLPISAFSINKSFKKKKRRFKTMLM